VASAAVVIAPASAGDLDAIDEISRHSFKNAWPRQSFADELVRPHGRLVVARDRDVVGYLNYWMVADEVHLLAIATHPDHRRRGVGGLLLDHLLAVARATAARMVTLEVRRTNIPAIALYERRGFKRVGVRPAYYQEDGEDAVVMTLDL